MNSSSIRSPMHSTVCCGMAVARASKSNISDRFSSESAIRISGVEKAADIGFYGVLERGKSAIVAGCAQSFGPRFGEILIAAADRVGHLDIFDVRLLAERSVAGEHQLAKAARLAGADIEDAIRVARGQQPHDDARDVVDIDEIAPLIAV